MSTLLRILSYTRRYKKTFALSAVASVLFGLASASPVYLISHMVDTVLVSKKVYLMAPFILGFIGLFVLKSICMYASSYYMHSVGYRVVNDIRKDLYHRIIFLPISFFKKRSTGEIMSRFLNDISTLQHASSTAIRDGLRSFFEAVALLSIALYQNIILSALAFLVAPLIIIAIRVIGKRIKQASKQTQQDMGIISAQLQEAINGIKSIKAFNGEQREKNRFAHTLSTYFASIMKCIHYEALSPALVELIAVMGSSLVLYVATIKVLDGSITPGQLSSLLAAILLAYQPIKKLMRVYSDIQYGVGAAQRVFDILDEQESEEPTNLKQLPLLQDHITLKNISFSYYNRQPILHNTSISIKHGTRIGIVGPSGIGKSTLSDLLLKFISPTNGKILFDNHDISQFDTRSLREQIGYVSQHPFLFNDTIYANVSYAKPGASMQEIVEACQRAHADEFIQHLPDGYHTIVGENGNNLSGGQKQRITIARALPKQPKLLIFDEATSALDAHSEEMIQQTLAELPQKCTVIVITHKPALLTLMDDVFTIRQHKLCLNP